MRLQIYPYFFIFMSNIFKIWSIGILVVAAYSIYKAVTTPIEETITIPTILFYILITWTMFGMFYVIKNMNVEVEK